MAQKFFLSPNELSSFFKKELANPNSVFVFSTDVVMNSWIDWCITHPEESGTDAVPLERFMAWDKFKGEAVRAKEEGKQTVPSILRKFFVSSLIRENAAAADGEEIFKKIINPQFKKEADSFADWITHIISSLKLWQKTLAENPDYKMDDEDKDYLTIFNRYSAFLEENNLYEPSWIDPDFTSGGKNYVIFYPELLEDFSDYKLIFEKCPEITLINLPEIQDSQETILCTKYPDSRKELRRTILRIRELCAGDGNKASQKKLIPWNEVTLNVPDLQTYRPYLERELTKYCVPFVIRAGYPLIQNTAGQIFAEIQDCYNSDFSYDSVRSLILDEYIPWKEDLKIHRQNLIQEGNNMRCICGYDEKSADGSVNHIDIWEEALSATRNRNELEYKFYNDLKKDISAICNSNSFEAISQAWNIFKKTYLSEKGFLELADAIIGRCITELNNLIEIENNWCHGKNSVLAVSNHYDFFVSELSKKTYTPQSKQTGISIYPYKTSAGGFFKYQFVIDASQKNLEIQYKKLNFLNDEKRRELKIEQQDKDLNLSKAYARLYTTDFSGEKLVHFSYAENSFAGFAIAHSSLTEDENKFEELDEEDFILNEKKYMLGKTDAKLPLKLSAAQKNQIQNFQIHNSKFDYEKQTNNGNQTSSSSVKEEVKFTLIENRSKKLDDTQKDGKIIITQSDMKDFFPCPRRWIFSKVLKLDEESLDTDLMQPFDMGNINHKTLELFMKDYIGKKLPVCRDGKSFDNEDEILNAIKTHAKTAIKDPEKEFSRSPLTQKMLENQIDLISEKIIDFLHSFLQENIRSAANISTKSKTLGYGGCTVKGVEKSYFVQNNGKNYNFYGKIDLLLCKTVHNPDNTGTDKTDWSIIDYKNSENSIPAASEISLTNDVLGDFQMPMYITLLQKSIMEQPENRNKNPDDVLNTNTVVVARFYAIKNSTTRAAIDINTKEKASDAYKPTMDAFYNYADEFEKITSSYDFNPDSTRVDTYKDCIKCNFKAICRRHYEIGKKGR
ncbi:PD-(D/E)XK nuclease family protein [Treponema sp. C6A8]|uniref:PD-(D/E)XK nuclease family protein n=1 Tax=Treponema sp. C6A8 TaxID=1410609 RepID=UPI000484ECA6|nr:PD-(D/E)XK nuclease family protein [Treponema sp. C6A8]